MILLMNISSFITYEKNIQNKISLFERDNNKTIKQLFFRIFFYVFFIFFYILKFQNNRYFFKWKYIYFLIY